MSGLLRIGEALSDIKERLAALMGRPGGPLAGELADLATVALDLLDIVEGDLEAEPDDAPEDGGDAEPSLGGLNCAPENGPGWWGGRDRGTDQTR